MAEPEVELDLAKTARRAGLDAYFESEATQKVRLAPAMAYMLDLWLRVLQILAMRLRVANRWVGDAQRLLHVVGALGEGGEGEDAPAVVKGAHTGEDAESLLSVAVQEGIQSKHRFVPAEALFQIVVLC
jgi:preprotein translocase subunit Sec61beta